MAERRPPKPRFGSARPSAPPSGSEFGAARTTPPPAHFGAAPTGIANADEPLQPGDFENFCRGVKQLLGVDLSLYKRKQMERRARGLASRNHAATLTEYLKMLRSDPVLLDRFMERMTITVSQLWRNNDIFEAIEEEILPELNEHALGRRLKLWSAGCSYGAEPYTLASICRLMGDRLDRDPLILGTDINPRMIERAKTGRFTAEDARDAPPQLLQRFFEHVPPDGWVAKPELKQLVNFRVENLFEAKPKEMDLILFRNVAIHFERERRDEVHSILAQSLIPGGILVLGSTEMIVNPGEIGLERVRPFIFRRLRHNRS